MLDAGARLYKISHLLQETIKYGRSMLVTTLSGRDDLSDLSSDLGDSGAIYNLIQKDRVLAAVCANFLWIISIIVLCICPKISLSLRFVVSIRQVIFRNNQKTKKGNMIFKIIEQSEICKWCKLCLLFSDLKKLYPWSSTSRLDVAVFISDLGSSNKTGDGGLIFPLRAHHGIIL